MRCLREHRIFSQPRRPAPAGIASIEGHGRLDLNSNGGGSPHSIDLAQALVCTGVGAGPRVLVVGELLDQVLVEPGKRALGVGLHVLRRVIGVIDRVLPVALAPLHRLRTVAANNLQFKVVRCILGREVSMTWRALNAGRCNPSESQTFGSSKCKGSNRGRVAAHPEPGSAKL